MQGSTGSCGLQPLNDFGAGMTSIGGAMEIKTQFCTREGEYRLLPQCEYGRPNRVGYNSQTNTPVRVSFVQEKICYNVGRELYIYIYKGIQRAADLSKPIDKKVYKGSYPTCHDFNQIVASSVPSSPSSSTVRAITPTTQDPVSNQNGKSVQEDSDQNVSTPASDEVVDDIAASWDGEDCQLSQEARQSVLLLVGFSAGQVQIVDPVTKDHAKSRLFNDERLIDRSKVTCLAWVPFSTQLFLVAHTSGHMYLYKSDCISGPQAPHYQVFKTGHGFTIHTCRSKQTRNPLFRWVIGEGSINSFAFSPGEGKYLATVSQDGVMRCFEYGRMDLIGSFRSYFGGLLCVAWSPDSKYVLCGGEDDLITLWSVAEKRVVARGQGHNSWVNCVQFDPFLCGDGGYRFGSVGQDTQLCLWDVNESDMLKQPKPKKISTLQVLNGGGSARETNAAQAADQNNKNQNHNPASGPNAKHKDHKENAGTNHKEKDHCNGGNSSSPPVQLGSAQCPRLNQVPMLEPLICKRIALERLTSLHFREDCIVVACQEGFVFTWARPGARSEMSEGADFGTGVAAAFIDGDAPSTTNSLNNKSAGTSLNTNMSVT